MVENTADAMTFVVFGLILTLKPCVWAMAPERGDARHLRVDTCLSHETNNNEG